MVAYPSKTVEFDDVASTTLAYKIPGTFEQSLNDHPIVRELTKNRVRSGMGDGIEFTPTFGDNPSVGFITSSTQKFEYTNTSVATTGRIDPAIMVGYVIFSDEEEQKNSGDQQIADLVDLKLAQLRRTFKRKLARAFHSAGTVDGQPAIKGLRYWIPRVPGANVIGNIDESAYPWWQSKSRTNAGAWSDNGWFGTNNNYPLHMFVNLTDGADHPSLMVSDAGTMMTALNALGKDITYTSSAAFGNIGTSLEMKFMGQRWVLDKDTLPGTMYMLNPEHWIFVHATSGDDPENIFTTIPIFRIPNQPLLKVQFTWGRFQLICTQRNSQGAIFDWTLPS